MFKKWLWVAPFIFFFMGYMGMARLMRVRDATVPPVLGHSLQDGLLILTSAQLYGHIMGERDTDDLPSGTIIDQLPQAGTIVKAHQSIGLLVAKRPPDKESPLVMGKQHEEIMAIAKHMNIRVKEHWIEHSGPRSCCIAQYPSVGAALPEQLIHVYYSKGSTPVRVVPDLKGGSVPSVRASMNLAGITPLISHSDLYLGVLDHSCDTSCVIIDQKPLPGTLLVLGPEVKIHLLIAEPSFNFDQ